jgi:hypothetical protein
MIESIKDGSFVLLLMGWAFILGAAIPLIYTVLFRWGTKVSFGKVIRVEITRNKHGGIIAINPIIKFLTYRGEEFEIKSGIGHGLKFLPKEGDTVKIYYYPDNPQKNQVAHWMRWVIIGAFMLVGVIMMLMVPFIQMASSSLT